MAISSPTSSPISLVLVVICLFFPTQFAPSRSLFLTSASTLNKKSSTSGGKRPLVEPCCFVGTAGCTRKLPQRTQLLHASMMQASSSLSENHHAIPPTMDSNECEFNLQKARLMARFSSVAYEDPPKSKDAMAGSVEQFEDNYGVSITRPIFQRSNISQRTSHDLKGAENNTWNMAHFEAMSPRPLMLMLSGCNDSGMSESEKSYFETAQFQWVSLATSQNTSAQFDAWRISSDETNGGSGSDAILVIAFRGTRLLSFVDLLTDIQLKQDMISCSEFGLCMENGGGDCKETSNNSEDIDESNLMAHSGFLRAYTSIRSSLLQLLSENAGTYDRIWFCGHSLGAAMATLAVVDVGSIMNGDSQSITVKSKISSPSPSAPEQKLNIPKVSLSSYLFGTPRVGNRIFADRLARLQHQPEPIVQEYYRINTPGDAVVFLPRGKVVNRLNIDYVHAGASVFLPALSSDDEDEDSKTNGYGRKMMQLEEDAIEQINHHIFNSNDSGGSTTDQRSNSRGMTTMTSDKRDDNHLSKIRIYPKGDQPPDPLSEIDPEYPGFFPMDPRTWASSNFQKFVLGETVRSFRILRGGFVKNHKLKTYEDALCLASQDTLVYVDPLQ